MTTDSRGPWLWARQPREQPALRLFMLPYAGGSCVTYRDWSRLAPEGVEICPIELPGHGARIGEPLLSSMDSLVEQLLRVATPLLNLPFGLFGHSMGGLVAFELAKAFRREGAPTPCHLFVSGCPAPQTPSPARKVHLAPDAELRQRLVEFNGTPRAVLENQELMSLALPILRADIAIMETYQFHPGTPLEHAMTVLCGRDDPTVRPRSLVGWQHHAQEPDLVMLPGDHFYLQPTQSSLVDLVVKKLTHSAEKAARVHPTKYWVPNPTSMTESPPA